MVPAMTGLLLMISVFFLHEKRNAVTINKAMPLIKEVWWKLQKCRLNPEVLFSITDFNSIFVFAGLSDQIDYRCSRRLFFSILMT
jgi:hypothetical protein